MWKYTANFIPNNIFVWGCGGTGSRFIPLMAQFIKTCGWIVDPKMYLIDDDVVEEKNLIRQNFVSSDVGKPKAQVLAQRYSKAYNLEIIPVQARIPSMDGDYGFLEMMEMMNIQVSALKEAGMFKSMSAIHVLCVDSPTSRRSIIKLIGKLNSNNPQLLIIDTGNENDFGQVIVSNGQTNNNIEEGTYLESLPDDLPMDIDIPYIPMDLSYYTEMVEITKTSCADLDQTMAINAMMAVTAMGIIQNFYYAKPIVAHRINVSLTHGSFPEYIDTKYFKKLVENHKRGVHSDFDFPRSSMEALFRNTRDSYKKFLKELSDLTSESKPTKRARKVKEIETENNPEKDKESIAVVEVISATETEITISSPSETPEAILF